MSKSPAGTSTGTKTPTPEGGDSATKRAKNVRASLSAAIPSLRTVPPQLQKILKIQKAEDTAKMGIVIYGLAERQTSSGGLFSPSKKKVAVVCTYNSVYICDTAGGGVHRLILYADLDSISLASRTNDKSQEQGAGKTGKKSTLQPHESAVISSVQLKVKNEHDTLLHFVPSVTSEIPGSCTGYTFARTIKTIRDKTQELMHEADVLAGKPDPTPVDKLNIDPFLSQNPGEFLEAAAQLKPKPVLNKDGALVNPKTMSPSERSASMREKLQKSASRIKLTKIEPEAPAAPVDAAADANGEVESPSAGDGAGGDAINVDDMPSPRSIGGTVGEHELAFATTPPMAGGTGAVPPVDSAAAAAQAAQTAAASQVVGGIPLQQQPQQQLPTAPVFPTAGPVVQSDDDSDTDSEEEAALSAKLAKIRGANPFVSETEGERLEKEALEAFYRDLNEEDKRRYEAKRRRKAEKKAAKEARKKAKAEAKALRQQQQEQQQAGEGEFSAALHEAAEGRAAGGFYDPDFAATQCGGVSGGGTPQTTQGLTPPPALNKMQPLTPPMGAQPPPDTLQQLLQNPQLVQLLAAMQQQQHQPQHAPPPPPPPPPQKTQEEMLQELTKKGAPDDRDTLLTILATNAQQEAATLRQEVKLLSEERDKAREMLQLFLGNREELLATSAALDYRGHGHGSGMNHEGASSVEQSAQVVDGVDVTDYDRAFPGGYRGLAGQRANPLMRSSSPNSNGGNVHNWHERYLREQELVQLFAQRCDDLEKMLVKERARAEQDRLAALAAQQAEFEKYFLRQHDEISILKEEGVKTSLALQNAQTELEKRLRMEQQNLLKQKSGRSNTLPSSQSLYEPPHAGPLGSSSLQQQQQQLYPHLFSNSTNSTINNSNTNNNSNMMASPGFRDMMSATSPSAGTAGNNAFPHTPGRYDTSKALFLGTPGGQQQQLRAASDLAGMGQRASLGSAGVAEYLQRRRNMMADI